MPLFGRHGFALADALDNRRAELLRQHGLPTRLQGTEPPAVLEAMQRDKKRRGAGPVPFVLVGAPGDVHPGASVPEDEVEAAVRELLA